MRYVDQALQRGASALLTDQAGLAMLPAGVGVPVAVYEHPREAVAQLAALLADQPAKKLTLIGVTGTNGKTSVSWMIHAGLIAGGQAAGLIGTLGVRIGDSVVQHPRTTPEAPDLNRTFALMTQQGASHVVMEVSSIAVEESRVHGLHFDTAIFTNLSHDHLDYHGDMETYFAAKAALFDPRVSERGIVVIDDSWGKRLAEQATIPIIRVSLGGSQAEWYRAADAGTRWIYGPEVRVPIPAFMPEFSIVNYMCALAALQLQGIEIARVAPQVAAVSVPGRLQPVANTRGLNIIIDYAHTPDAVERILADLLPLTTGRLITVIGAGGERDAAKRIPMGKAAAQHSSVVVITDDNPRSEEPGEIRAAIRAGALQVNETHVEEIPNRADAIRMALEFAEPGDTVAILGKGAEDYQEIGSVRVPFSDEATVRTLLREMT
jgi:UDP-N-acetylmuramoyl-L-alanyl-D-glutamate--2,6-diaminopimelate ligase